jgi:hypothetical protein
VSFLNLDELSAQIPRPPESGGPERSEGPREQRFQRKACKDAAQDWDGRDCWDSSFAHAQAACSRTCSSS